MICYACLWLLVLALLSFNSRAEAVRPPTRFGDTLFQIFQHERCLNCHQFNSRRSNGKSYTSHRNRYLCENCHRPSLTGLPEGGWIAPNARMDYTGLNARETCELIKRNVGSGDKNALLHEHMLHDVRIRWALESGMTLGGRFPAVPGGYWTWKQAVEDWAKSGMPCD